jgi:hypothetical protein
VDVHAGTAAQDDAEARLLPRAITLRAMSMVVAPGVTVSAATITRKRTGNHPSLVLVYRWLACRIVNPIISSPS